MNEWRKLLAGKPAMNGCWKVVAAAYGLCGAVRMRRLPWPATTDECEPGRGCQSFVGMCLALHRDLKCCSI